MASLSRNHVSDGKEKLPLDLPSLHKNFCEFHESPLPEFANGEIGGDGGVSAASSGGDRPFSMASITRLLVISGKKKNTRHRTLYPLVIYDLSCVSIVYILSVVVVGAQVAEPLQNVQPRPAFCVQP
jgi:hypothetical protein